MGMTDAQFDSYKKMLLRRLEEAEADIKDPKEKAKLSLIIEDLREELRKP